MPWRSPYMPVNDVRMSSAVCAISGVWLFDRNEPLFSKKFSRFGMSSRSDGTFGLSRKKWTLSKVSCTTCLTPLPRLHVLVLAGAALLTDPDAAACADPDEPATATPASSTAAPARAGNHLADLTRFMVFPPGGPP